MVICKFYQQGTCRFGNNCRYEHSYYSPNGGRYGGHQYTQNNYYHDQNKVGSYQTVNTPHNLNDIMEMIIQEVTQTEKGGQWPLSCFAPLKEGACFPGFEDHSPEEIRWMMYESLQNGTINECNQQVKTLYDRIKIQRNYLRTQKDEAIKTVERFLRGQKAETESNFSFVQQASLANNNKFSLWNSNQFSQNQQQNTASNNFTFSLPQLGGSGSSGQPPIQQQSSIFGSAPQAFAPSSSQSSNVFVNPLPTQSVFGNVNQETHSAFQQQVGESSNVFGIEKTGLNISSSASTLDTSVYTPNSELSQDEISSFIAQTFTMGKVPTKPPPREMCSL